jgi:uroporphyrinogen-III synthase
LTTDVPPRLDGTAVLVTRPQAQAAALCNLIEKLGGTAIRFPTIVIEPLVAEHPSRDPPPELVVFTSVNAVAYGRKYLFPGPHTRVAAIGAATATAARAHGFEVHLIPTQASSEGLLDASPQHGQGARAIVVQGAGGRNLLPGALARRGFEVTTLEVYERQCPKYPRATIADLEQRWAAGGIDVVTVTSVAIFMNLHSLLTEIGRGLLRETPLVTISDRIASAVRDAQHTVSIEVAERADDVSIVTAVERARR